MYIKLAIQNMKKSIRNYVIYFVIGIVIDTEKEAEKCSFLSAVLDCKIENFAKITDFFLGGGRR